jgi:DEAD/DEAH box helicase domain-containing protein
MEQKHFSELLNTLATRSGQATVSWLGFANTALRRHLLEVFSRSYGDSGSFLGNPTFEAVFGWRTSETTLRELSGGLLHPSVVKCLDSPDPDLASEYRFPADRRPYVHQVESWKLLSKQTRESVVVTSGTGSGKTECFLIPILNDLAQEGNPTEPLIGVRALFLYPLNALINSQRDRLRAWTHGHGRHIQFSLYNGMTPDVLPVTQARIKSEIRDRRTLRASPPPILVTNATMLEYMLVRSQDAPILDSSQGKLRWIILDEAHTYIGSQAAELALLIRRVLHAFGVTPEDVRFVATSATIGDPNGAAGDQLREFLARVSGSSLDRVHVVAGQRTIPKLPIEAPNTTERLKNLQNVETDQPSSDKRYIALSSDRTARSIRDLFTSKDKALVARLSEVCRTLYKRNGPWSREEQSEALEWLDLLTGTSDALGTPFLPLRGHVFHQTFAGLWCCSDNSCSGKRGSSLSEVQWPFGKLYLEPRRRCTCGAPVFELIACQECGAIYLRAAVAGNKVVAPNSEDIDEEFVLDIDPNEAPEPDSEYTDAPYEAGADFERSVTDSLLLIANREVPHSEVLYINTESGMNS